MAELLDRELRITICSALNTPFSHWGKILYNTTIAAAVADRLIENSQVFLLGGPSLRKEKRSLLQAPRCDDSPRGGVRRVNPSSALQVERESSFDSRPFFLPQGLIPMFNFSANHLALLHCQVSAKCTVFIMRDHSTHRTYRLYDFSKSFCLQPNRFYAVSGKVNSADKLYLVLESVKPDTKHSWPTPSPLTPDGTGG